MDGTATMGSALAPGDICRHTGGRGWATTVPAVLLQASTGWKLHQLRHSAATHLGDKGVPLQLIMAKTRHKSPRTAMRYVSPGPAAVADITQLLDPPRRSN